MKSSISLGLLFTFFTCNYAMEPVVPVNTVEAHVKATFVGPSYNLMKITSELLSCLQKAKTKILIAVYYITNDLIINALLKAKKKGVDVQIIFDERSPDNAKVMNTFLANNIVPIIYPSEIFSNTGIMHHKFVVIDDEIVITGSANFTRAAFDPTKSDNFNYENIVTIYSNKIARDFSGAFSTLKRSIFDLYIDIVAQIDEQKLPVWFKKLSRILHEKEQHLRGSLSFLLNRRNDPSEQQRASKFFEPQSPIKKETTRVTPATAFQRQFLQKRGIKIEGLSISQANNLMKEIKQKEGSR